MVINEKARGFICPLTILSGKQTECITSDCMAWCWLSPLAERIIDDDSDPENVGLGFCGLATCRGDMYD